MTRAKLRASFGAYESSFHEAARIETPRLGRNERTRTLILFGPSDHVIYPDFDLMAAVVLPNHVGPFLLARLRPLRALGGPARPRQRHRRLRVVTSWSDEAGNGRRGLFATDCDSFARRRRTLGQGGCIRVTRVAH